MTKILARLWTACLYLLFRVGKVLSRHLPEGAPSNCYLWAIGQQEREGGTLHLVNSKYGSWLHCEWVKPDGTKVEFMPKRAKGTFRSLKLGIPPLIFIGYTREVKETKD